MAWGMMVVIWNLEMLWKNQMPATATATATAMVTLELTVSQTTATEMETTAGL